MTKTEFKRLIHEAEVELTGTHDECYHFGVCVALMDAHTYLSGKWSDLGKLPVAVLFEKITSPLNNNYSFWFGSRTDEHNRHVRMIALRLFEQYVLSEKLYLEL